jgi:hypothetical protein
LSIVAERRRTWLLPAGICLAAAIAVSVAVLLLWKHPQTSPNTQPFSAAPAAEQAPWKISSFPAGALAKVAKIDKAAVATQLSAVETLVRNVYDAQLMDPRDLPKVLERSFTHAAAATFEKARLGVPKGATDVRSTKRHARIGVDIAGAKSAAAEVTISLKGELKGETLLIDQHSTLWMQKLEGDWRVVGYDVSQGPAETNDSSDERGHTGGKNPGKKAGK